MVKSIAERKAFFLECYRNPKYRFSRDAREAAGELRHAIGNWVRRDKEFAKSFREVKDEKRRGRVEVELKGFGRESAKQRYLDIVGRLQRIEDLLREHLDVG